MRDARVERDQSAAHTARSHLYQDIPDLAVVSGPRLEQLDQRVRVLLARALGRRVRECHAHLLDHPLEHPAAQFAQYGIHLGSGESRVHAAWLIVVGHARNLTGLPAAVHGSLGSTGTFAYGLPAAPPSQPADLTLRIRPQSCVRHAVFQT